MHIQDIFAQHRTTFSFEFFPPKTDEASEELFKTIASLQELQPSFVSVTYGAGGSTRDRTHDLVVRIEKETDLTAVSHLTCVCHNLDEMTAILDRYAASGIENILALSGDPPRDNAELRPRARRLPLCRATGAVHPLAKQCTGPARFRHRRRGLSRGPPRLPEPAEGDGLPEGESRRRGGLHLHATLLRQSRLLRLPRTLRTGRDQGADRRRHHADHVEEGNGRDGRNGRRSALPGEAVARRRPLRRRRRGRPRRHQLGDGAVRATCCTTASAASTSTRSTAPTRRGRFTRTSASPIRAACEQA